MDANFDFFFKIHILKKNLETSKINKRTVSDKSAQASAF